MPLQAYLNTPIIKEHEEWTRLGSMVTAPATPEKVQPGARSSNLTRDHQSGKRSGPSNPHRRASIQFDFVELDNSSNAA
ncbi:hypothetical protein PM082_010216 [Marasmius tenuissimus]|nr:hypothetical protein PM082_010216 [Marasmius tenuissimus]